MEMWFENHEQMDRAMFGLNAPGVPEMIQQDEARFLDRSKIRMFTLDERDSDLTEARS